jgi:gamma-glutamyltranspeptidase/glutathione hydrolase
LRGEDEKPAVFWGTETVEAKQQEAQHQAKKGTEGHAAHAMVAACHNRSVEIGLAVLQQGGNAVDAFVAVTFADYVQSPGASSIGGPLGALVYSAADQQVWSVMAPLKTVASPTGQWRAGETSLGKQVLVPGAVAGLEEMHEKYGKLAWRDVVGPAAALARDGFPVDMLYATIVNNYAATVKRSAYGRSTYFHDDGTPLKVGETVTLPVLAETLDEIADEGAGYLQQGAWADECVKTVREAGGEMTAADLANYRVESTEAVHAKYRDDDVYGLGGHDSGGLRLLLALEVLAHADIKSLGHHSESLDGLETMIRVSRAVNSVAAIGERETYDNVRKSQAVLDGSTDEALWQDVTNKVDRTPGVADGSHSYSVVIVDGDGNAVAGTHTIESLPFGSGLFVGGVPLNNTGVLHPYVEGAAGSVPADSYLIEPLSATLAFRNGRLVLASSTFSASLWPADFQVVSSALDFGWNPERIALTPRFGTYAVDLAKLTDDPSMTQLDKRYGKAVVEAIERRGLKLTQAGYIDTGMVIVVERDPQTGAWSGMTPEQLPDGKAKGF